MELRITDLGDRVSFARHLVDRFGSPASASQCIEEMLKVCSTSIIEYDALKNIRYNINAGTYKKLETWKKNRNFEK